MSLIKVNGILCKYVNPIPDIIFASDDFVNINTGRLASSNVLSPDSALHFYNTYYYQNCFTQSYSLWDGIKRFCNFMERDITIDAPDTDEFSLQFYYSGTSGRIAGRLHVGNLFSFFMVYDDQGRITLRNSLPVGAVAYNGASLSSGSRSLPTIYVSYNRLGEYLWNFVSICVRKVDELYQVYLYINGLLQFSWTRTTKPDPRRLYAVIESGGTPTCVISEIMLFSYSRASQDMMTYPTNEYCPMYT